MDARIKDVIGQQVSKVLIGIIIPDQMETAPIVWMNATKIKLAKGLNAEVVTAVGGKMENVMMLMNIPFLVMGKTKCALKNLTSEVSDTLLLNSLAFSMYFNLFIHLKYIVSYSNF